MVSEREVDPGLAASLRKVERRVLAEVPLGTRAMAGISVTLVVLAGALTAAWVTTDVDGVWTALSRVAIGFGVAAFAVSLVALWRRRFGWCLTAAAISAVGVPLSVLGYWSAQTGLRVSAIGLVIAVPCHAVLVANWLRCARPPHPAFGSTRPR